MKMKATLSKVKTFGCCSFILILFTHATAQLVEIPIGASTGRTQSSLAVTNRTQALNTVKLPFWDDFSYSDVLTSPNPDLWQYGQSVLLNNGIGINPPSKNVVTFDGTDSLGHPYNVNDATAKGIADKLVSAPIRLDLVPISLRNTVYLSFFFQVQGLGEAPDTGDYLILSFKNANNQWEFIRNIENNSSLQPNTFYQVLIPVVDPQFFFDGFQFRIQNFARLSGPYDTWNVDYVYLNSGRSPTDTSYPDRTISSPLNSLFDGYFAMPFKHFIENPSAFIKQPSLTLYNLKAGNLQPFDYTTAVQMTTKVGQQITTATIPLDVAQDPGAVLVGLQFLKLTLNKVPPVASFNPLADSIGINFKYGMSTKDNVLPINNGDYDPLTYSPIDFRLNDSIRTQYVLSTYYAYDDGSAEYGAGLNQAGSYLAFKYLMKSQKPDTLLYVDIYFPDFGDKTTQSLLLQVRSSLSDSPSSIFTQQVIQVNRTTQNKFKRYKLEPSVIVKGDFFIVWKQSSSTPVPVGLDKNTDNGDKVYYNTNGTWVQNVVVKGSMMVRPGFGRPGGNGPVTALKNETARPPIYPNPTRGLCYLPVGAENIIVVDLTGRKIESEVHSQYDATSLELLSPVSGLVVVRYCLNGKAYAEKIMVREE